MCFSDIFSTYLDFAWKSALFLTFFSIFHFILMKMVYIGVNRANFDEKVVKSTQKCPESALFDEFCLKPPK